MDKKRLIGLSVVVAGSVVLWNCDKDDTVFGPQDVKQFSGSVSGRVQDQRGRPVPGAMVTVYPGGVTTVSGDSGKFEIGNMAPGSYRFALSKADYRDTTRQDSVRIGMLEDKRVDSLRLAYRFATVKGEVDLTGTGNQFPGVVVEDQDVATTVSPTGKFTLGRIEPGHVRLFAACQGVGYGVHELDLTAGDTVASLSLLIDHRGGTVSGTVVDTVGHAISGAKVTAAGGQLSTGTDLNGRFSLPNVPPSAMVRVASGGLATTLTGLVVPEGGLATVSTVQLGVVRPAGRLPVPQDGIALGTISDSLIYLVARDSAASDTSWHVRRWLWTSGTTWKDSTSTNVLRVNPSTMGWPAGSTRTIQVRERVYRIHGGVVTDSVTSAAAITVRIAPPPDREPPTVRKASPSRDTAVANTVAALAVSWTVSDSRKLDTVWIDSVPARVDSGKVSKLATLVAGRNVVRLVARDSAGNVSWDSLVVMRAAAPKVAVDSTLASLMTQPGTLYPTFRSDSLVYRDTIGPTDTILMAFVDPTDPASKVLMNGIQVPTRRFDTVKVALSATSAQVQVYVVASDNDTLKYLVNVVRRAVSPADTAVASTDWSFENGTIGGLPTRTSIQVGGLSLQAQIPYPDGAGNGAYQVGLTDSSRVDGIQSLRVFLDNHGASSGTPDFRLGMNLLAEAGFKWLPSSDTIAVWMSTVDYTESSRWAWSQGIALVTDAGPVMFWKRCATWGLGEHCMGLPDHPGSSYGFDDAFDSLKSLDGRTWHQYRVVLPDSLRGGKVREVLFHAQQASWDGTRAQSRFFLDRFSGLQRVARSGTDSLPTLHSLSVDSSVLRPTFDSLTTTYFDTVAAGVASVTVRALATMSSSSVVIDGRYMVRNSMPGAGGAQFPPADSAIIVMPTATDTTIHVKVYHYLDTAKARTYTIRVVHRAATLDTLGIPGLVAYYPFNGDAKDGSGNGMDGMIQGGVLSADRFGVSGRAVELNGADGYIGTGKAPFSENWEIAVRESDGAINNGTASIQENRWASVMEVFDSVQQRRTLYIDGVAGEIGSWTGGSLSVSMWVEYKGLFRVNGWQVLIGQWQDNLPKEFRIGYNGYIGPDNDEMFFNGKVDDVRLYNRTLTSTEIQKLYHEGGWTGSTSVDTLTTLRSLVFDSALQVSPAFDSTKTSYVVTLAAGKTQLGFTPTTSSSAAAVKFKTNVLASGTTYHFDLAQDSILVLVVSNPNRRDSTTYTVTVRRQAASRTITLSGSVRTSSGSAKVGVGVALAGTALSTTTDAVGSWSLSGSTQSLAGTDTLVYSYGGTEFLRDTLTNLTQSGISRTYVAPASTDTSTALLNMQMIGGFTTAFYGDTLNYARIRRTTSSTLTIRASSNVATAKLNGTSMPLSSGSASASIPAADTITRIAVSNPNTTNVRTYTIRVVDSVATPTFSLAAGTYPGTQALAISCPTIGANIYYTIDGSAPTASSTSYGGAISVSASETVRAIAVKNGVSSAERSAQYVIVGGSSATIPWNETITYDTLTDSRDGQKYRTVQIGTQRWMAENLNRVLDSSWCYDNVSDSCAKYGRLYTWAATMNLPDSCNSVSCPSLVQPVHQGICPTGWHVPSDAEWSTLTTYIGEDSAGTKLKSTSGWSSAGKGTDAFGFRALPGGDFYLGTFSDIGNTGMWRSSTESGLLFAWTRMEYYKSALGRSDSYGKSVGYSLRCSQD